MNKLRQACRWRENWPPVAFLTLALIVLQQSIVAGSSLLLVKLSNAYDAGSAYSFWLLAYMLTMFLPYIPGCLGRIALAHWINVVHQRIVDRLAHAARAKTSMAQDRSLREAFSSAVSRNSFAIVGDYVGFIHGFWDFLLNSVLSIAVIGFILPGNLVFGYFASLIACTAIISLLKDRLEKTASAEERWLMRYGTTLNQVWPNAVLGNQHHFAQWLGKKEANGGAYYASVMARERLSELSNILLAAVSLGPTIFLVYHAVVHDVASGAVVVAIFINLTRIFLILNSLSALVHQAQAWPPVKARMKMLLDMQDIFSAEGRNPPGEQLLCPYPGTIRLNERVVHNEGEVNQVIGKASTGRFTIRGDNGAGKSTLLYHLKNRLGEHALLVPVGEKDLVWEKDVTELSSGERSVACVLEATGLPGITHLLLDEWDANLDAANRRYLDEVLDQAAKRLVVVEVRHREGESISG